MILIVDDRPENIFSLKRLLDVNGFETDTAGSGEDALKKILHHTYALIILDVQMPGMDGFEVAEAISGFSKAKDIPIIFLSAVNTDKKFITKGYTSGAVDYITKPVDPDIFILKVRTLHRLYEQNRELHEIQKSLRQEVEIRKETEQELQSRMKELRSVLESMPQIAFTATAKGEIEYANEPWYVYSEQVQRLPETHPADSSFIALWHEAISAGSALITEVRIKNLITREYRYHLLKMIPVKESGRILRWVGTFTDIHEQKAAHDVLEQKVEERTQELLDKNRELENSNYDLQQFASVASHDLKEPLRKIQVFSSILRDRHLADSPDAHSVVSRIIESSGRMNILINDLLNYSRLSVEGLFQPVNLNEIIQEILYDLELQIKETNAVVNICPLPTVDAIPGQMRQMFQNLLSNALKFTRSDVQPVINIDARYAGDEHTNGYCEITIRDNGIGFNEKYTNKIFTIFQRLNPKEAYEGTGIGLAIVKKIVDKHNGTITAHSTEGQGATFIIRIPLKQSNGSTDTAVKK